jgi:predicted nucleotidyltransferase
MQQPRDLTRTLATLDRPRPIFAHRYRVQPLGAFGSYVRHAQLPDSDLDISLTLEEPPGWLTFLASENSPTDAPSVEAPSP